jgi:hypothetical protein
MTIRKQHDHWNILIQISNSFSATVVVTSSVFPSHQNYTNMAIDPGQLINGVEGRIRDVWAFNLAKEIDEIRDVVETYKFISMVSFILL